jgi:glycosyltransferase involved in cell wall biosynthesis
MKVKILFRFKEGPWGGGNQFLLALKDSLSRRGSWAEDVRDATIVLFDSFNDVDLVLRAKNKYPWIPFVHRVNGPISVYRGRGQHVDKLIYALTHHIADGVIFQSEYSENGNIALGMRCAEKNTVIHNAARPMFFQRREPRPASEKVQLIATSWSSNINKGFDLYRSLDDTLDFSRYALTFVGSSPFKFKNIRTVPPQDASSLLRHLKSHDIYLTASKNDPCSNAVLEALAVGLPVVALRSGGTPELVGSAGEYFDDATSAIRAIDIVASDIQTYSDQIRCKHIDTVCEEYISFFTKVLESNVETKELTMKGWLEIQSLRAIRKGYLGLDKLGRTLEVRS